MKKRNIIFIIVYLAYTSIYIARLNLSVATPGLQDPAMMDTVLTSGQIGMLGAAFSCVFAIGRFINGSIADKQPPWVMISTGLAIAGISNIAVGFFPPFVGMMVLWMCNAFAQSMLWSSVLCVVSSLYEPGKAKTMASYMVTSVATGNILAILVNSYIISKFGINFAFIIPGCIVLVLGFFVLVSTKKIKAPNGDSAEHMPITELLKNKQIRLTMIPTFLHGIIKDNVSFWMVAYFVATYSVNLKESALFVLFIPIIGLVGRLLYPFCSMMFNHNEYKIGMLAFLICGVAAVPLLFGSSIGVIVAVVALSLIYAATSVINTAFVSIFPIRYIETGNVASLSGLFDLATYMGAGFGSFVYGFVIDHFGYSPMYISWVAISVISIALLSGLLKMGRKA